MNYTLFKDQADPFSPPACAKCGVCAGFVLVYESMFLSRLNGGTGTCEYGQCPNGEHLHKQCKSCGYRATVACMDGTLGEIVQDPYSQVLTPCLTLP